MDSEEEFLFTAAAVCIYIKKKKPKRKWTKQWLQKRSQYSHTNLLKELTLESSDWRNYLRMDEDAYFQLLNLVTPIIKKRDTNMRQSISPHERLTATLRYLASGMSYEELKYVTIISPQCLGVIIPETCKAIITVLKNYMKFPESADEWEKIAEGFETTWNFPHCLGAVDGKHIRINPPSGSGSYFYNYKKFHSVVLMACANANYEFIWCEVGTDGRLSDGGAIQNTKFYQNLCSGDFKLPKAKSCGNSSTILPFVFVGDEAFDLRPDFMKPYSQKALTPERKLFNDRLSRARRTIENAFGIISKRFRIFHTGIGLSLHHIDIIILTCCILHNFLKRSSARYMENEEIDTDTNQHGDLLPLDRSSTRNITINAKPIRDAFLTHFNEEGNACLQNDRI